MSAHQPPSSGPGSKIRHAAGAWFAALAVFLAWLLFTVAGGPASTTVPEADKKSTHVQDDPDKGYIVDSLPPQGSEPTPSPPFGADAQYVLVGYGLQGLYQSVPANRAWTISLPPAELAAQLVKRGASPSIVIENITLTWEADPKTVLLPGNGEAQSRSGEMKPAGDGLSFIAQVPVTAMQTDGSTNPYPVLRISAREAGKDAVLAESAAVVAVAPGFGCALCHADAEFAILEAHDRHQATALLEQARQGTPVNCRTCHDGVLHNEGKATAGFGLSLSAAIHGWHSQYLGGRRAESCMACHTALGRSGDSASDSPGDSHGAGVRPLFARDLHMDRGLDCVNCHGSLEDHALALLKAEKEAGQPLADKAMAVITSRAFASTEEIKARLPWTQLPDCTGCHSFETKPRSDNASAFNKWTENESALFSQRTEDMAVLRCPSCHGAPHAVYPASNPVGADRDNIAPLQYQRLARPLGAAGNCAACHMQGMDFFAHHPLVEKSGD